MKIGVIVNTIKFIYSQTGNEIKKNYICQDDIITLVNPLDELALEYALALKEKHVGVSVTAVSLGDASAVTGLRKCLAVGADRAFHLRYDEYEALDPFATSALLARACRGEEFDLILTGATRLSDNDCTEGPYVAGRLGIPHITTAVDVSVDGGKKRITVQRVIERGDRQIMECSLPALVTIQKGGALIPRYPTLAGTLKAESAPIAELSLEKLGLKKGDPEISLCLTETVGYSNPKPRMKRSAADLSKLSADQRIDLFVNRDASQAKEGGNILEGASEELYAKLDTILVDAGIFKE